MGFISTPLFIAAQAGHTEIVDLLLQEKADITHPFTQSANALMDFASKRSSAIQRKMYLFIKTQSKHGVSKDAITVTPYQIACIMGNEEIITYMREHGAAPESIQNEIIEKLNECLLSGGDGYSPGLFKPKEHRITIEEYRESIKDIHFLYSCFGTIDKDWIVFAPCHSKLHDIVREIKAQADNLLPALC